MQFTTRGFTLSACCGKRAGHHTSSEAEMTVSCQHFRSRPHLLRSCRIVRPFHSLDRRVLPIPHCRKHLSQQAGTPARRLRSCTYAKHTRHSNSAEGRKHQLNKNRPKHKVSRLKAQSKDVVTQDVIVAEVKPVVKKLGTLWGLLVLALAYVHHSTTG